MTTKQNQKGGDQSTNMQVEQVVVHVGIDEKRAREVFQEMNLQLRRDYTQEALDIANTRVSKFEESLMPKMEQIDGALESFADPSFQLLLVEAQKTAASTERPADYDLLSELLIHRFKKGNNRITQAGISLAVGIVDKVSDDALLGLTAAHAISIFYPVSGDIYKGLDVLNNLFGKILYEQLPSGQDWLDHLDVLKAIRLTSFSRMPILHQIYSNSLHGYIDVGIQKGSEDQTKAIKILDSNNLPRDLLVEHSLNTNFLRIPIPNKNNIKSLFLQRPIIQGKSKTNATPAKLTKDQIKAINSIYDLYSKDKKLKQNNIDSFMDEWEKRLNLKPLKEWWDKIPIRLNITSVGKVLAHSNAQRCDRTLPPLN